ITADGKVVIAGFNPFSLAGILKYLPINKGNMLHQGRFFTAGRIKDWLQLMDFEIVQHEHLVYSSLFADDGIFKSSPRMRATNRKLVRWYRSYLPWFACMYVIVAKKSTIPMSTAKPIWQIHPTFKPRPATAALRGRNNQARQK
ncbi:MAG: SAM-dependent methyltransferase, partial [Pseudomonadota bacterium]